jgi:RNA recognition motif-containing protein
MNNKVYCGNLSFKITEDELKEVFAQIGSVASVRIITDAMTGRSKGFGFIEMETEEDANKAIEQLNGTEVQGRALKVAPANPPRERSRGPS